MARDRCFCVYTTHIAVVVVVVVVAMGRESAYFYYVMSQMF